MTRFFEKKLRRFGTIDTKKFRYRLTEIHDHSREIVVRIPVWMLSTTDSLIESNWETVKIYG